MREQLHYVGGELVGVGETQADAALLIASEHRFPGNGGVEIFPYRDAFPALEPGILALVDLLISHFQHCAGRCCDVHHHIRNASLGPCHGSETSAASASVAYDQIFPGVETTLGGTVFRAGEAFRAGCNAAPTVRLHRLGCKFEYAGGALESWFSRDYEFIRSPGRGGVQETQEREFRRVVGAFRQLDAARVAEIVLILEEEELERSGTVKGKRFHRVAHCAYGGGRDMEYPALKPLRAAGEEFGSHPKF